MKKKLLVAAGTVSTGLGILGIFLPVLPTTPFLLLAAACFVRSSERLHYRLLHNRYLGWYILDYVEGRGMTKRHKAVTIAMLWLAIIATVLFTGLHISLRILLVVIALLVSTHIARLPTKPPGI